MRKALKTSDWTLSYDDDFDAVIHHCATLTVVVEKRARGSLRPCKTRISGSTNWAGTLSRGQGGRSPCWRPLRCSAGKHVLRRINVLPAGKRLEGAFIALSRACHNSDIELIDCQVENPHLLSLARSLMSREDFENHVRDAIKVDMRSLLSKPLCMVPTPPPCDALGKRLANSAGDLL